MFLLHGLCIYHLCLTHISDAQKIYSPYLFICSKHKTNIYIYILKTQIQKYYLDVHYIYIYMCNRASLLQDSKILCATELHSSPQV